MEQNKKKILTIITILIEVAFLALIIFRKYIFEPDSLFFNLYEESMNENTVARIIKTIVAIVGGSLVSKVATMFTQFGETIKNNKTKTSVLLLGNILKYASAIAVIFIALPIWGIDTTAIATGAGVVTLILGLGCQSMISDIVAGVFILFEGDIQVGDVVVVNGWRGTVQQIGLRRTKIMDTVGNINIINNSSISNVINNTKELSQAVCEVGIEYDESLERVENVLRNNLDKMKEEIPAIIQGPYYMGVSSLGASAVMLKIIAKVNETDKFQTERDLNRAVKILFDKNNINIPYDQITISNRETSSQEEFKLTAKEILEAKKFLKEQREYTKQFDEMEN